MPEGEDYYQRILEQRRAESSAKGVLAKISPDFYPATQRFLAELYQLLEAELRSNPTSKKVEFYRNQYQRTRNIARDIMDWRMSKIAALAVQAVVLGSEPENLLPEEKLLFDKTVAEMVEFRTHVSPSLEAHRPQPTPPAVVGPAPAAPVPSPKVAAPPAPGPKAGLPNQMVVRVLKDGQPFAVGEGDSIELRKEDVVLLPEKVGKILSEAKLVERVESG